MLEERKASILRAVVEQYIETAQPVGSGRVVASPDVNVSSATVRNELASLEDQGYLSQPHTSAGRVPTEKAYRFFVDSLPEQPDLDPDQRQTVKDFFDQSHSEIELMLTQTSRLLASLTGSAAVVVAPNHDDVDLRSIQLVGLGPTLVLVVTVLGDGTVEKHMLESAKSITDANLTAASARLAEHLIGTKRGAVSTIPPSADETVDEICDAAIEVLTSVGDEVEQAFVGGASNVVGAFDAVEKVEAVLTVLEKQLVIVSMLRDVVDRGLTVAIGSETGLARLADVSVVVAPYEVEGREAGSIGVLGPSRMDYTQALATVAVVSRRLGARLTAG